MPFSKDRTLIAVEKHNDGLVVLFDDGTCVFFSTALLYAMIPEAELMDQTQILW